MHHPRKNAQSLSNGMMLYDINSGTTTVSAAITDPSTRNSKTGESFARCRSLNSMARSLGSGSAALSGNRRPISAALRSSAVMFFLYNLKMSVNMTEKFLGFSQGPRLKAHIRMRPKAKYSKITVAVSCVGKKKPGVARAKHSPTTAKAEAPAIHFQNASGSHRDNEYIQKNRELAAIRSFLSTSLLVANRRATSLVANTVPPRNQVPHDLEELILR